MQTRKLALACLVMAFVPAATNAAVLYGEAFDTDVSANWTTVSGPGTNTAEFGFDYSTLGIPKATTGQADTRGLRLTPNTAGVTAAEAITGLSTSPNGQSFSGDYVVRFNAWQNYGGTSGTTILSTYGVGTAGTASQRPGSVLDSVLFGATTDGGSAQDYRAYGPGGTGAQLTGVYTTTSQNNSGGTAAATAYYESIFPGVATSPVAQGTVQSAPSGTPAFTWQLVEIYKIGNTISWVINGKQVALVNASTFTLGGGNIFLGASDINNTGASSPNLVFGLVDNLSVDSTVPEPTSIAALGALSTLVLRRRK